MKGHKNSFIPKKSVINQSAQNYSNMIPEEKENNFNMLMT